MPALSGTYFYADFCAGFVRSFRYQNGQPTEQAEWPLLSPPGSFVTSFGEDAAGELYVMTQEGGLFKFIPKLMCCGQTLGGVPCAHESAHSNGMPRDAGISFC